MLAVIKTGGKQYLVKQGDIFKIEKIEGEVGLPACAGRPAQAGKKILFKDVLLCFDDKKTEIGQPTLKVDVEAEIVAQEKGKKVTIVKYKPKTRYHKKRGHRQLYTRVKILKIGTTVLKNP